MLKGICSREIMCEYFDTAVYLMTLWAKEQSLFFSLGAVYISKLQCDSQLFNRMAHDVIVLFVPSFSDLELYHEN
jgi:hypothetical protein